LIAELAGRLDETELRYRHAREYAGERGAGAAAAHLTAMRDRFDPLYSSLRDDPRFLALSDPRRSTADRDAAVPVVARLASTLHVVDRRCAPFLVSPFAEWPDDPPVWPGRPSKGPF
jgi:hypothetical protein